MDRDDQQYKVHYTTIYFVFEGELKFELIMV